MKLNNNDDSHNSGLNLLIYNMLLDIGSHPAWVCGLKLDSPVDKEKQEWSHPAWVCGLKHIKTSIFWKFKTSHPAWVCGLKPMCYPLMLLIALSHPAWVCGLKLVYKRATHTPSQSHTLRGCVDWNQRSAGGAGSYVVTPCVGVWIETG